jgi:hypothetical protein
MTSGSQPAPQPATAESRLALLEVLGAQLLNDSRVKEVWKADGAVLLTVYHDNGADTVGMELESGDWLLVRVSDPVDVIGREGGGTLSPLTR